MIKTYKIIEIDKKKDTGVKTVIKSLMSLFIWLVCFVVSMFIAMVWSYGVILCGIIVFGLIPTVIYGIVKADKMHKSSIVKMDIEFRTEAGRLFAGNTQLLAEYNTYDNTMFVYDVDTVLGKCDFAATIESQNVAEFMQYLKDNGIYIEIVNEPYE